MDTAPDLRAPAAAGFLAGVLYGWRKGANPGALDNMVQSPYTYTDDGAHVSLTFADGATFSITCVCTSPGTDTGSGDDE